METNLLKSKLSEIKRIMSQTVISTVSINVSPAQYQSLTIENAMSKAERKKAKAIIILNRRTFPITPKRRKNVRKEKQSQRKEYNRRCGRA